MNRSSVSLKNSFRLSKQIRPPQFTNNNTGRRRQPVYFYMNAYPLSWSYHVFVTGRSLICDIPKIWDCWFDCKKNGYDNKNPYITLCEIWEIRSSNHTNENAAPLQAGDVKRRPFFGPEEFQYYFLVRLLVWCLNYWLSITLCTILADFIVIEFRKGARNAFTVGVNTNPDLYN